MINCFLHKVPVESLWDTGSQISLMGRDFLEENFPGAKMYSVSEFLGDEGLTLTAANQTELSVVGVVVLSFGAEENSSLFDVPFLITSDPVSSIILGYNVIEYLILNFPSSYLSPLLSKVVTSLPDNAVNNMVEIVKKGENFWISC